MSTLRPIVTGDDYSYPVQLFDADGETPVEIDGAATASVAVVSVDRSQVLVEAVAINMVAAGSNLPQGIVVVAMADTETAEADNFANLIRNGAAVALLEVQVVTSGLRRTYYRNVQLQRGNIAT